MLSVRFSRGNPRVRGGHWSRRKKNEIISDTKQYYTDTIRVRTVRTTRERFASRRVKNAVSCKTTTRRMFQASAQ